MENDSHIAALMCVVYDLDYTALVSNIGKINSAQL